MKVTSVLSFLLLAACAQTDNPLDQRKDSRDVLGDDAVLFQDKEVDADYEPLGCFNLRALKKEKILGKVFKKLEASSSGTPLENCGQSAQGKNVQLFGIYYRKKKGRMLVLCREGDEQRWHSNAKASRRCKNRIGRRYSVFIYRVNRTEGSNNQCTLGNKSYSDGEYADMYHPTDNILNAYCEFCMCSNGKFRDCFKMYCDIGFIVNCKQFHHPPGACCPECKEYYPVSPSPSPRTLGNQRPVEI